MRAGKIYRLAGMLMAAMLISEGGAAAAGTDTVYAATTAKSGKSSSKKAGKKASYVSAYQGILKDYLNGTNYFDKMRPACL